ncbi:MAG: cupin domain-containing protein [Bacteroidales bacterium]|nr:cupin domain-containing protein [Bacteroidales bacterium]MBN2699566.1 cupin domain-containing protein [Bacteroidales bacterium]
MATNIDLFGKINWQDAPEYPDGTKKMLLRDHEGAKTVLLKLPEGFYMATHSHVTSEQHILLQGEYISEGKVYRAGTYQKFETHESHGPFESKAGALVLVIWESYKSGE